MLASILQFFKLFRHLGITDLVKLQKISRLHEYEKGELIASEGERFPYMIAVRSGVIRTYEISSSGEERTTLFTDEGNFTGCSACLLEDEPSKEYLEALEDCKVVLISIREYKKLTRKHPQFQDLYAEGISELLAKAIDRVRFFTILTPEERYVQLLKDEPQLIQRIPQKYLASYLGITPVSLSRIRKRVSEMDD